MSDNNRKYYGQISLSLMCNLRHKFCFQTAFSTSRLRDDILYEKLLPLYPQIGALRILGGEPTVIPGIREYLLFLRKNNPQMEIEIITNGVLLDESWVDFLIENKISMQMSVNGISPDTFRKIMLTGNPEKLRKHIYKNLAYAVEQQRRHEDVVLINCISMVVNDDTKDDLDDFMCYALENGLNVTLQFPNSNSMEITEEYEKIAEKILLIQYYCADFIQVVAYSIPDFVKERVSGEIGRGIHAQDKASFLEKAEKRKSLSTMKMFLYCHGFDYQGCCEMPTYGFCIQADGSVYPCNNTMSYPLGNLYFDNLDEIMSGSKRRTLQKQLHENNYQYCYSRCNHNPYPETSDDRSCIAYEFPYKKAFLAGDYGAALQLYEAVKDTSLYGSAEMYEHAYCLHVTNTDLEQAVTLYSKALKAGFDAFWVRYNRADACLRMGKEQEAREDIRAAYALNPQHKGIQEMYEKMIG
ncbi:radical SAM protein [Lachnospiraceae bacterium JLR.KK008]